ncbi:MAG: zinc ribbon domain-containing protein [Hungatella sp.]|nr:zinc ribbon domain-containing protein [Hungatella sp.]
MKCPKCGAEMMDGAVFCGDCGARMDGGGAQVSAAPVTESPAVEYDETEADTSGAVEAAGAVQEGSVFCPNCGKRLAADDVFCDECGYQLNGDSSISGGNAGGGTDTGGKKADLKKILIPVGAVAAVAVVVGLGSMVFSKLGSLGSGSDKVSSKLIYVKDDALMMADLKKKKATPVEITDSYTKKGEYVRKGVTGYNTNLISEDGKYLYYMEDRDSDKYDLYQAKMSKPSEGTKIDSKVSSHRLLKDGTVLYRKSGDLYRYSGKKSERIIKDVESYFLDEDQKYICWTELDDGEITYYLQDLAQKKDKVTLEDDVDDFKYKSDFSAFYVQKGDTVSVIDREGNKEKIAKDVDSIRSFNRDSGRFFYVKENPQEIPYGDFLDNDNKEMSESDQERFKEEEYTFEIKELYLYDGKSEQLITDRLMSTYEYSLTEKDQFFLYREYPNLEELEVAWSDVQKVGMESAIQEALVEIGPMVLATDAKNKTAVTLEEDVFIRNSAYGEEDGKLYCYTTDEDYEDGMIQVMAIKGSKAGTLEEFDSDVEDLHQLLPVKGGLYYVKDYEDEGGDLCFNGKVILSDVLTVRRLGETQKLIVASDYDMDESSYEVSIWNGKKKNLMSEEVNELEYADNGSAIFLVEYNYSRGEGELVFFDGKEARTIDDDVTSFFARKGSSIGNLGY